MTDFDSALQRSKLLENRIISKLEMFSSLNNGGDIESGSSSSNVSTYDSSKSLANDIDMDLNEMDKCINTMHRDPTQMSHTNKQHQVKRLEEIHCELGIEYRNIKAIWLRNAPNHDPNQKSTSSSQHTHNKSNINNESSATSKLLRERSGITNNMKGVNDVLESAYEAKSLLMSQRNTMSTTWTGLSGMMKNVPSFNQMINKITSKKHRENVIVYAVIAVLICFSLWWMFMR
jgi:golgi SNAP receptor complex member 1